MSNSQPEVTLPSNQSNSAIARMEALGRAGITISVCFGPSAGVVRYSVQCLHDQSRAEFDRPFGARDFAHCIEIAEIEAVRRGWIVQMPALETLSVGPDEGFQARELPCGT
jgi:hypothetical protein